ncbi:pyruvate formate-lyase-activating protein [Acetonema longum]|uniref:Pyruvate formate-lyase-activating enzyme n=1 Tax=Acetonema longum DSM 6540 TaxID=1009370 RepID=F7NKS5_9FIRM|nr:pyruvate formate-lyase-activating protein [Acetonema longum]EGO63379.1 pyruvate formate-lyase activating enzyme [Acetonema longum DSM 6540]
MRAYYHSVETFGTVDGPGIRYVLFLAGCSMGCTFCHNPDTWQTGDKQITVDEVLADMERYRPFYENSGGGLTVSGGEPLQQAAFVAALFAAVRQAGFSTVLDTSGCGTQQDWDAVLPVTDIVQFSLKAVNPATHRRLTRTDGAAIRKNFAYVASQPVRLVIRFVVIPGLTDTREEIEALGRLLQELPASVGVEFLPYHALGKEKWRRLGLPYVLEAVREADAADIERVKAYLSPWR